MILIECSADAERVKVIGRNEHGLAIGIRLGSLPVVRIYRTAKIRAALRHERDLAWGTHCTADKHVVNVEHEQKQNLLQRLPCRRTTASRGREPGWPDVGRATPEHIYVREARKRKARASNV